MFPRASRVRAGKEWAALFQDGYGVSGPLFSLRVRPTPGTRRVGVSVGKKVGGAVTRNRVKRRLRELAKRYWDSLPEADIALLARPACGTATWEAIDAAFRDVAARSARKQMGGGRA